MHGILDRLDPLPVPLHPAPQRPCGHGIADVQRREAAVALQIVVFIIKCVQHLGGKLIHAGAPRALLLRRIDHDRLQHAVRRHFRAIHIQRRKVIDKGIAVLGIGGLLGAGRSAVPPQPAPAL